MDVHVVLVECYQKNEFEGRKSSRELDSKGIEIASEQILLFQHKNETNTVDETR